MTEDRRVRRTRRALQEALFALILQKGYERVTVQDVLDRADVGRSTFYGHFRDKEALLLTAFDGMSEDLRSELDAIDGADPGHAAEVVYGHAYQHRDMYRAMCGRHGGELVHRHLHRLLCTHFVALTGVPGLPAEVVAQFRASATIGLLDWAIDNDFPHDAAWLADAYRCLAAPGVPARLG